MTRQNLQNSPNPNTSVELQQPSELRIKSFPILPAVVITLLTLAVILIAVIVTSSSVTPQASLPSEQDKSHAAGTAVQSDALIPHPIQNETPADLERK